MRLCMYGCVCACCMRFRSSTTTIDFVAHTDTRPLCLAFLPPVPRHFIAQEYFSLSSFITLPHCWYPLLLAAALPCFTGVAAAAAAAAAFPVPRLDEWSVVCRSNRVCAQAYYREFNTLFPFHTFSIIVFCARHYTKAFYSNAAPFEQFMLISLVYGFHLFLIAPNCSTVG